jgi:hypothetical protein
MTTHTIDREEVMAYVDGELTGTRFDDVAAHLETCDECRGLIKELRQVSTQLASWQVGDPPDGLRAVQKVLRTSMPYRARTRSWLGSRGPLGLPRWSLAAGLAIVAMVLVLTPRLLNIRSHSVVAPLGSEAVDHNAAPADVPQGMASTAAPTSDARPLLGYFQGGRAGGGKGQGQQRNSMPTVMARSTEQTGQQSDRMIVRSATISLTSDHFEQMRQAVARLTTQHQGRVAALTMIGDPSTRRSLRATLRVPAAQLDALLAGIRTLGRVQSESIGTDDVTESFRDLGLRTANARREEQRLVELLSKRTGDLADVLAVERELARVRLDIERMEAETRATQQRVNLATIDLTVSEQYHADLAISALPLSLQLRNALVDGCRDAAGSLVSATLFILQVAPLLIVWLLLLVWPARWGWRRLQAARSS